MNKNYLLATTMLFVANILFARNKVNCTSLKALIKDAPYGFVTTKGKVVKHERNYGCEHPVFGPVKKIWSVGDKNSKGLIYDARQAKDYIGIFDPKYKYEPGDIFFEEKIGLEKEYEKMVSVVEKCLFPDGDVSMKENISSGINSLLEPVDVFAKNSGSALMNGAVWNLDNGARVFIVYYEDKPDLYLMVDYIQPQTGKANANSLFHERATFENNFNTILNDLVTMNGKKEVDKTLSTYANPKKNESDDMYYTPKHGLTKNTDREEVSFDFWENTHYSLQLFEDDSISFSTTVNRFDQILKMPGWQKKQFKFYVVYGSEKGRVVIKKMYSFEDDNATSYTVDIIPVNKQGLCTCTQSETCSGNDILYGLKRAIDQLKKDPDAMITGTSFETEKDGTKVFPTLLGFLSMPELSTIRKTSSETALRVVSPGLGISYTDLKKMLKSCFQNIDASLQVKKDEAKNIVLSYNDGSFRVELVQSTAQYFYFDIITKHKN